MSARSAIVRKKQKPPARSISAVRDPPASHWQGGPSPAQQQFRATTEGFAFAYEGGLLPPSLAAPRPVPPGLIQGHTYVPALNIIDLDFERSPPATAPSSSRDQTAFNQGQTGTSTSSCSSEKGHRSSSKIEKSVLRAYVDSKSDAFRNKLSFKALARKPSADHLNLNVRSTRGAHVPLRVITTPYTPPTISSPIELSRLSPQYQAAPVHSPTPFSVPELCSSGGRPRPSGSDRFGQHLSAVKRWIGEGKSPQPWSKIRKDPELWDPTGDTLVYLGHEYGTTRPGPSLRVHASSLEATGSIFFKAILREGYMGPTTFDLPVSPSSPSSSALQGSDGMRDPSRLELRDLDTNPSSSRHRPTPGSQYGFIRQVGGHLTPPSSETSNGDREHPVLYELFFPAPLDVTTMENLRHHLTTRNVFALIFRKALVGFNIFQMLLDLHERLQLYMLPDSDNASVIINHIVSHHLDDVRAEPTSAAGLLAWCETSSVRWYEGWREAFVHCSGMYDQLKSTSEFFDVSQFSRNLLDHANLEVQVRVQHAAEKLAIFDFADIWPMQSVLLPPARESFYRFRHFLVRHYGAIYGSWPAPARLGTTGIWLTREITKRLQSDFGALYDYLVDRDMTWEAGTSPQDREWRIVSKGAKPHYRADGDGLPLTSMLLGFDNRNKYPHIPHPYPLLPPSRPLLIPSKQNRFAKKARQTGTLPTEQRVALDYSEATNLFQLGPGNSANNLVEVFAQFEKSDMPVEVDPSQARKGRWVLLYAILQVLATVSVDTPGLRFTEKVPYFLNPQLRGTPPWRGKNDAPAEEATHELSYCWTVPKTWEEAGRSSSLANINEEAVSDGNHPLANETEPVPTMNDGGLGSSGSGSGRGKNRQPWIYGTDGSGPNSADAHPAQFMEDMVGDWPIRSSAAATSGFVAPKGW